MLALTADACQAIEGILQQSETATGIRIAPNDENGSSGELQMSVADAPAANDEVVESEGAQVFVEESPRRFSTTRCSTRASPRTGRFSSRSSPRRRSDASARRRLA